MSEKDEIKARHPATALMSGKSVHAAYQLANQASQDCATLLRLLDEAEAERDALQARVDALEAFAKAYNYKFSNLRLIYPAELVAEDYREDYEALAHKESK